MLLDALQSRRVLKHAFDNHYAILAVNADSPACLHDCLEAARQAQAPIIVESSLWQLEGRSFGAGDPFLGMARFIANLKLLASTQRFAEVPVIYHTDHIKGPLALDILEAAIRGLEFEFGGVTTLLRASTLSLDASEMSDEENIATILRLGKIAEEAGQAITLEMESAIDDGVTPPETTRHLVGAVESQYPDLLSVYAPGLGTRHGYSAEGYPEFNTDRIRENVELVKEITGRDIGLALHGSSGLSAEDLRASAEAGVVKVNWSTESLRIRSTAAQEYYTVSAEKLERGHPQWKVTAMDNGLQSYIAERYIPRVVEKIGMLNGQGQSAKLDLTVTA